MTDKRSAYERCVADLEMARMLFKRATSRQNSTASEIQRVALDAKRLEVKLAAVKLFLERELIESGEIGNSDLKVLIIHYAPFCMIYVTFDIMIGCRCSGCQIPDPVKVSAQ